jgi:hypothetical protein
LELSFASYVLLTRQSAEVPQLNADTVEFRKGDELMELRTRPLGVRSLGAQFKLRDPKLALSCHKDAALGPTHPKEAASFMAVDLIPPLVGIALVGALFAIISLGLSNGALLPLRKGFSGHWGDISSSVDW